MEQRLLTENNCVNILIDQMYLEDVLDFNLDPFRSVGLLQKQNMASKIRNTYLTTKSMLRGHDTHI